MSKVIIKFDTDEDSAVRINAAIKADQLALCVWEIREKLRNLYDQEEINEEMLNSLMDIIDSRVGYIDDYTE